MRTWRRICATSVSMHSRVVYCLALAADRPGRLAFTSTSSTTGCISAKAGICSIPVSIIWYTVIISCPLSVRTNTIRHFGSSRLRACDLSGESDQDPQRFCDPVPIVRSHQIQGEDQWSDIDTTSVIPQPSFSTLFECFGSSCLQSENNERQAHAYRYVGDRLSGTSIEFTTSLFHRAAAGLE